MKSAPLWSCFSLCFHLFLLSVAAAVEKPSLALDLLDTRPPTLQWSFPVHVVRIHPPEITVMDASAEKSLSVELESHNLAQNKAILHYQIRGMNRLEGQFSLEVELPGKGTVLCQRSTLRFLSEVRNNITVTSSMEVVGATTVELLMEDMDLIMDKDAAIPDSAIITRGARAHSLSEEHPVSAYYAMGLNSTDKVGQVLSMPVVGLLLGSRVGGELPCMLAVSSDPYSGTQLHVDQQDSQTRIQVVHHYSASVVPLLEEQRTMVLEFHRNGADGMFNSFYQTIPEVAPAPAWVHDIALAYYDYNSDNGKGWYKDIESMTRLCPPEHRDKIVLCLHGWYDKIGFYCYDHRTGTLLEEWQAFVEPKGDSKPAIPMSKEEIHRRIQFAKERGFRVILYYADGMNCTGTPEFHKGQVFVDEKGQTRSGWTGPCGGGGPLLDPTSPPVREWFLGYLEALLHEYGKEIDGFVFDETNLFMVGDVSYRLKDKPAYADRAMMTLMRDLTLKVQEWRKVNPSLVMLEGSHYFYGLVANGSFTDYPGLPLVVNYRNASWTCSWWNPGIRNVHTTFRCDPTLQYPYGLDMGLSNGYGSDTGPSEMDPKVLDEVFAHFLKRVADGPERPKIPLIDSLDDLP